MKKSNGYILIQEVLIFMLCSILLVSAADTWKNALLQRLKYQQLSEAVYLIEDYQAGKPIEDGAKITSVMNDVEMGLLMEFQAWEKNNSEQMVCNLFRFKKKI